MTIAIGFKYPWGELKRLPPLNSKIPEAIILASDSKFCSTFGGKIFPITNLGTKLFQIGNTFAAVYAGNCEAGELCFNQLRQKPVFQDIAKPAEWTQIASETINETYCEFMRLKQLTPDNRPLYILVGTCNEYGEAHLYHFGYNNNFIPEIVTDGHAISWPNTRDEFYILLNNELKEQVESELLLRERVTQETGLPAASLIPMPIKAEHMAIRVVSILCRLIESGTDITIGGQVQCTLIDSNGVSLQKICSSPDPTNTGPGWTRATAEPHELHTITGISGTLGSYFLG